MKGRKSLGGKEHLSKHHKSTLALYLPGSGYVIVAASLFYKMPK